jgi:hypothetical protein
MNQNANLYPVLALALVVSLALNVILGYVVIALILQPSGKPTCKSFSSYQDILQAFPYNPQLDGYPKDGIPCNGRRPG